MNNEAEQICEKNMQQNGKNPQFIIEPGIFLL